MIFALPGWNFYLDLFAEITRKFCEKAKKVIHTA